ncbi:MAG: Dam family site-specific DNA-(adenine-N6)-methyltransferase [Methanobrevibacter sp.]|nr:Dam family site-specific DNA-(adenine-N6)-methyltransferase [Candidatus Methanoflexus mossambicus]
MNIFKIAVFTKNKNKLFRKTFDQKDDEIVENISENKNKTKNNLKSKNNKINKYFEPFIGGGAFFFYLVSNYNIKEAYLYDINRELILTYNVIKNDVEELINELLALKNSYLPKDDDERKEFYYDIRNKFNEDVSTFNFENYSDKHIIRGAYTIFLNKTCFNGLFRLNKKGEFNVPIGRYKNPAILDVENLRNVSKALKIAKIYNKSFLESEDLIDENSLVYLDPPYRPLNKTSNFTSYSQNEFTDNNQIELGAYFKRIISKGAYAILSNSDPKNEDKNDNFFDDLYSDYDIRRVKAKRFINRNANKRGEINELLIKNY